MKRGGFRLGHRRQGRRIDPGWEESNLLLGRLSYLDLQAGAQVKLGIWILDSSESGKIKAKNVMN